MASQKARRKTTARRRRTQKAQSRSYNAYMAQRAAMGGDPEPQRRGYRVGYITGRLLLLGIFGIPVLVGIYFIITKNPG